MKKWLVLVLVAFFFTGCEKANPVKKWAVQYRVYKKTNQDISFRVRYITHSGATEFKGPFNGYNWESDEYPEFENGSYQFLAVETISGKGELQLQIKVNGSIYEEGTKGEFEKNFQIESNL